VYDIGVKSCNFSLLNHNPWGKKKKKRILGCKKKQNEVKLKIYADLSKILNKPDSE